MDSRIPVNRRYRHKARKRLFIVARQVRLNVTLNVDPVYRRSKYYRRFRAYRPVHRANSSPPTPGTDRVCDVTVSGEST